MAGFDYLVEQRIAAARDAGELDNLPGEGRPLDLGDDRLVPEELRVAHRILKNAGFLPPEIEARRCIVDLGELVRRATDDATRKRAIAQLALLNAKLEAEGRSLPDGGRYYDALVGRLGQTAGR